MEIISNYIETGHRLCCGDTGVAGTKDPNIVSGLYQITSCLTLVLFCANLRSISHRSTITLKIPIFQFSAQNAQFSNFQHKISLGFRCCKIDED